MSDYINLLESKPTNYRIFLYNLMKEVPTLKDDFLWPDIGLKLVKANANAVFWRRKLESIHAL